MESTPSSSGETALSCSTLRLACCALALALGPWGVLMAQAPQTEWNAGTGNWFLAGNWDPEVPTEDHVAIINNDGTAVIGSPGAVARLVEVGLVNEGELQISGTLVTGDAAEEDNVASVLGLNSSGSGTATVSGIDAEWQLLDRASLRVGGFGVGHLTVSDGAHLYTEPEANFGGSISIAHQSNSEGYVTVSGAGSQIDTGHNLRVGGSGDGTLLIEDGGSVTSASASIGFTSGTGTVTVTGAGSQWINNNLFVGNAISAMAEGTLIIADGGLVQTNFFGNVGGDDNVASNENPANGEVLVTGDGSLWNVERETVRTAITEGSTAQVILADKGLLSIDGGDGTMEVVVPQGDTGTTGMLTIGGRIIDPHLAIPDAATPEPAGLLDATTVVFGNDLPFGHAGVYFNHTDTDFHFNRLDGSPISLSGHGRLVHLAGTTTLDGPISLQFPSQVLGGTLVATGTLDTPVVVDSAGTLAGNGVVGTLDNSGTVTPGNLAATLHIDGDYNHSAGATYEVDLDSDASDLLSISGQADLQGGSVSVTVGSGSYPAGDRFTILSASGNVTGTFGDLNWDDSDFDMELEYDGSEVTLVILQSPDPIEDIIFQDRFEL